MQQLAPPVSTAQQARSILAVAHDLWVGPALLERHVVLPGGALLVAAPHEGAPEPGAEVLLEVTDVSTVPQPDRVRARLRVHGTWAAYDGPRAQGLLDHLRGPDPDAPDPTLVRLLPTRVELASSGGSWSPVDLVEFGRVAPEPFVAQQHRWLPHLQAGHADAVRALAERVLGPLTPELRVFALGLDRFGVTLRVYAGGVHVDVRSDFAAEVGCGCDVREAITALLHA